MTENKKSEDKRKEEKRKAERFAWLGPLLERRTAEVEPLGSDEEQAEELEEIKK